MASLSVRYIFVWVMFYDQFERNYLIGVVERGRTIRGVVVVCCLHVVEQRGYFCRWPSVHRYLMRILQENNDNGDIVGGALDCC